SINRELAGTGKFPDQYLYMDPFDFRTEEEKRFEMEEASSAYLGKKRYQAMKDAYLAKRPQIREENLKAALERDFDLKVVEANNFNVAQTGRFLEAPAML